MIVYTKNNGIFLLRQAIFVIDKGFSFLYSKKNYNFGGFLKLLTILVSIGFLKCSFAQKPSIIVSTKPYENLIGELAGDHYSVSAFVPLGEDAHHFIPSPRAVEAARGRILWFGTGASLERHLDGASFIDLSKGMQSHHPWLDPLSLKVQLTRASEALTERFPSDAPQFVANLKRLHERLDQVHAEVLQIFQSKKPKTLVAMHPSLDAFCARYDIELLSLEEEGKESTLSHMEKIAAQIRAAKLTTLLSEPDRRDAVKAGAQLGLDVAFLSPYCDDVSVHIKKIAKTIRDL